MRIPISRRTKRHPRIADPGPRESSMGPDFKGNRIVAYWSDAPQGKEKGRKGVYFENN